METYHKAVDMGNSAQCVPCEKGDHECCWHDPTYERCGCHARGHGQPLPPVRLYAYEIRDRATKEIIRRAECDRPHLMLIIEQTKRATPELEVTCWPPLEGFRQ